MNGKTYNKTYITQDNIVKGGELEFVMGSEPNYKWGIDKKDVPPG
ncbi:hypothetical protein [Pedobacter nutrimenti]|nr:hypothetical protein [Pedobacter nutrimenti]